MNIAEIIIKKLNTDLTESENQIFTDWIASSLDNKETYDRLVLAKTKRGNVPDLYNLDPVKAYTKLVLRHKANRKKRKFFFVMKYASIFLIFLAGGYGVWQFSNLNTTTIAIDPNSITLDLGNGKIISVLPEKPQNILDESGNFLGKSTATEINYSKAVFQKEIAYNFLKVPKGKIFNVRLSDGTLVHLNSDSSLKYPTAFSKKGCRNVTLTGEAFFEVSKDKKHPFVVSSNSLNITVLGTKFNVSSYPEDKKIKTVLVEGSVKLSKAGKKAQFLKPGYKAVWDPTNGEITFSKVDTSLYTKWMNRELVISQLPFDKVIKKLERFYGVTIENRNQKIINQVYTAEFADQTIEEVLSVFQVDTPFEYKIKDKQIIIY